MVKQTLIFMLLLVVNSSNGGATFGEVTISASGAIDNNGGFHVNSAGKLSASDVSISGTISGSTISGGTISGSVITTNNITATGGYIAGWEISDGKLSLGSYSISMYNTGNNPGITMNGGGAEVVATSATAKIAGPNNKAFVTASDHITLSAPYVLFPDSLDKLYLGSDTSTENRLVNKLNASKAIHAVFA